MPRKKPLKGVGEKEQRQYEHIKESAEKSGRYGDRAEEVAARTVMKQHKHNKPNTQYKRSISCSARALIRVLYPFRFSYT